MKLYYAEGACSLAPHIVLEELGIAYDAQRVSFDQGENEKPEFLKLNPRGAVPVLALDDGSPLTENLAILPYLADLKPEAKLIPQAGSVERLRCMEWLAFGATEVHSAFRMIYGAKHFAWKPEVADDLKKRGLQVAQSMMKDVERRLGNGPFVLGEKYSIVDPYFFVFFNWAKYLEFDLNALPKYSALASRVAERPAVLRVLKSEGLLD